MIDLHYEQTGETVTTTREKLCVTFPNTAVGFYWFEDPEVSSPLSELKSRWETREQLPHDSSLTAIATSIDRFRASGREPIVIYMSRRIFERLLGLGIRPMNLSEVWGWELDGVPISITTREHTNHTDELGII